jgi:aspartate dehydrogenase
MLQKRLAFIGYGAMSQAVVEGLSKGPHPVFPRAVLVRSAVAALPSGLKVLTSAKDLVSWKPNIVAECAGHTAVSEVVPMLLSAGVDVVIASIGALALPEVRERIQRAAEAGGSKYHLVSGAIGGLDALAAAKYAGLSEVAYEGRKPPLAWRGTPAEETYDLAAVREPTLLFEGRANDACRLFPKNANVTAAIALAGIGFEQTTVRLFADPHINRNQHVVRANGHFGELEMRLSNEPLPDNPKTSWLASLSVEQAIRRELMPTLLALPPEPFGPH